MKYTLRIRPAADGDVDDAAMFIAKHNLRAALRFYDAVEQTYIHIRDQPEFGPRYEMEHPQLTNLRKCSVVGFRNFLVFYLVDEETVDILRVLHGARDIPAVLANELLS